LRPSAGGPSEPLLCGWVRKGPSTHRRPDRRYRWSASAVGGQRKSSDVTGSHQRGRRRQRRPGARLCPQAAARLPAARLLLSCLQHPGMWRNSGLLAPAARCFSAKGSGCRPHRVRDTKAR
jgi:hypothetical protein